MRVKGVIFDFNGTLFWDSAFHDEAWKNFALKYANRVVTDEDMKLHVHGRINPDILSFVFGEKLSAEEAIRHASEKEAIYRKTIVAQDGLHEMAQGAEAFLDYLKDNNIPRTIATSSNKENVKFFFKHLNLEKWFDFSKVIFEELVTHPKPHPEIFINAASNINMSPKDCMVIEDSLTGLQAAKKAGIGEVVFIENNLPILFEKVKPFCDKKVNSFLELMS